MRTVAPPDPVPNFIVTDRSATAETRAVITPTGIRFEVWMRDPAGPPVEVTREQLATLVRVASLPPGGGK